MKNLIIRNDFPAKGNAYILFGFEAIQARPNLDPYTSSLRTNDETMQIFLSDVHIKHHVRRGLKAEAADAGLPHSDVSVFYEKIDEAGNSCNFNLRLKAVRNAFGIKKPECKDAFLRTLDLPLFGYVHAIKAENFNANGAVNTLFRPSTFHSCEIYALGRNNAFPTLDKKNGEVKDAAGSATVDSLEYGFFLALWEINLNMLRLNAEANKMVNWNDNGVNRWLSLFANGMWRAYDSDRYPSFTQRSQFAQFQLGWLPEAGAELSYQNPADLYDSLENKKITSHSKAIDALGKALPEFLSGWKCDDRSVFLNRKAGGCKLALPGDGK